MHIFADEKRDVAQPGSVLAWGASGRWFESSHPDKKGCQNLDSHFFILTLFYLLIFQSFGLCTALQLLS